MAFKAKTNTMGDEKAKTVKELRSTINAMSKEDFDDFDKQMSALKKKAYQLVQKLATA